MVNTRRINERIKQLNLTIDDLAIYMNRSVKSLTQLIDNEKMMVLYEAYMIADYLQISAEEICEYFFCSEKTQESVEDGVGI